MSLEDRDYMRDRAKRRRLKRLDEMRAAGDRVYHTPPRRFRWSKLLVIVPAAFRVVCGVMILMVIADRVSMHLAFDLSHWAQDNGHAWVLSLGSGAGIIVAVAWVRVRR